MCDNMLPQGSEVVGSISKADHIYILYVQVDSNLTVNAVMLYTVRELLKSFICKAIAWETCWDCSQRKELCNHIRKWLLEVSSPYGKEERE